MPTESGNESLGSKSSPETHNECINECLKGKADKIKKLSDT